MRAVRETQAKSQSGWRERLPHDDPMNDLE
jgi:hypothetical protein